MFRQQIRCAGRTSVGCARSSTEVWVIAVLTIRPGERDPEMHQTKKGNQWFFEMKGLSAWTTRPSTFTRWRPNGHLAPTPR